MARDLHDHWFQEAKREGYRSRAVYKLREIDEKRNLLGRGDAVLDCGCAPGSWMQYAAKKIGDRGVVVGIDLLAVNTMAEPNIHVMEGDLHVVDDPALLALGGLPADGRFNVVLSDMAPNTTGHRYTDHHRSIALCDLVLQRSASLLGEGGHLVMKVFEGSEYVDLVKRTGGCFSDVRPMRPTASRSESREMFIVAMNRLPETDLVVPPPASGGPPPVPDTWST